MLTRLIYASRATEPMSPARVDDILRNARAHNQVHDITGLLVFDHRSFLQVLEGDRQALSDLYSRLVRDPRHTQLLLMECVPVDERVFSDWSMGFVAADDTHRRVLLRLTARSQFDPHGLSAPCALALLRAMARSTAAAPASGVPAATVG